MATAPPRTVLVRVSQGAPRRGAGAARRVPPGRRPAPRRGNARRRRPAPRRRSRRSLRAAAGRWWPALLVAAVVLVGMAWNGTTSSSDGCTLPGSGVTVTPEQVGNARTIAQVGRDRGLPDRAVVIALATAQQESSLRNLDHGDRDSLGLFQQRPSQGWGTEAQVQDPVYAAGMFYDRLVTVPGWDTGRLTDVAQAVQRSGFPELYQQHEAMAVELTAALGPDSAGSPACA
ncbi:hypothetical protein [Blastococcus tunisiensis]|uniref:Uncharacterized protein n=1 Tax=Blastococcus tunisiensis TaxID=1798228 RepID=A0A1I2I610_9ACTN|nr:hypothetical protein [Blastococcus sp. DSM 46838]SFF37053.1 hypothetical protein SAMN05216574_11292 [Blastococcus sp. DSM 46838]